VVALDVLDNAIPHIPGEEEKAARETGKILGVLGVDGLVPAAFPVSATCTRAAVTEGHTEAVAVSLGSRATPADVAAAFRAFGSALAGLALPSAPERLITVRDDPFRPQPRLDRDADRGMTTSVGRIRADGARARREVRARLPQHQDGRGQGRRADGGVPGQSALKYFADGWWNTRAETDASGSIM
jgi:aspartate-semialdehyde dehydrogenase